MKIEIENEIRKAIATSWGEADEDDRRHVYRGLGTDDVPALHLTFKTPEEFKPMYPEWSSSMVLGWSGVSLALKIERAIGQIKAVLERDGAVRVSLVHPFIAKRPIQRWTVSQ